MAQIITEQPDYNFGGALGTALGGGLQQLVQQKIDAKGLEALGITKKQARGIAALPKELQAVALKSVQGRQDKAPWIEKEAELEALLSGKAAPTQGQPQGFQDQGFQDQGFQDQRLQDQGFQPEELQYQAPYPGLEDQTGIQALQGLQRPGQEVAEQLFGDEQARQAQQFQQQQQQQQQQQGLQDQQAPVQSPVGRPAGLEEAAERPRPSLTDPNFAEKLAYTKERARGGSTKEASRAGLAARKEVRDVQKNIDVDTKKSHTKINDDYKAARANNMRLHRMQTLVDKGKLTPAGLYSGLQSFKKAGIDLSFIQNPDSQEFEKLSADFLKEIKSVFGARITDKEVEFFLKTVPTLMQTDAGKQRVIDNLGMLNQVSIDRRDVMKDIIRENGGERPKGMDDIIEDRMESKLDQMALKFSGVASAKGKRGEAIDTPSGLFESDGQQWVRIEE